MANQTHDPVNVFYAKEIGVDPGPPRMLAPVTAHDYAIVLGSGKPEPTPHRFGPAGVVLANNVPYLIDAGEGVWRAIAKAAAAHDGRFIDALAPQRLTRLFITHFHSDHTVGLPSLLLLPWTCGRTSPLDIYGPMGTKHLISALLDAYRADIQERVHGPEQKNDTGWRATAHDIAGPGIVYSDENVEVAAFHHPHGSFEQNLGYRFTTQERTFVWAGDGVASESYLAAVADADVLFSDVAPDKKDLADTPWRGSEKDLSKAFHILSHTLASVATRANVKTIALHHEQNYYVDQYDVEALVREVKQSFPGDVYSARDGDVF
jgi:ribonuclease BN (tRNA processing enzyme)